MSTRRFPLALACFFTSVLWVSGADGEVSAARARAAELEAGLAAKREVYLVLGVDSRTVEIRVRGVTLQVVPLTAIDAYEQKRLTRAHEVDRLEIPRAFVTSATISLVDRRVVAPETLQPWSDEAGSSSTTNKDDTRPVAPPEYDVPLDGGWVLEVRQEPVDFSASGRFLSALGEGWSRLSRRQADDARPSIRVVVDESGARQLHHLFKKGTAILLVPDSTYRVSK